MDGCLLLVLSKGSPWESILRGADKGSLPCSGTLFSHPLNGNSKGPSAALAAPGDEFTA